MGEGGSGEDRELVGGEGPAGDEAVEILADRAAFDDQSAIFCY